MGTEHGAPDPRGAEAERTEAMDPPQESAVEDLDVFEEHAEKVRGGQGGKGPPNTET